MSTHPSLVDYQDVIASYIQSRPRSLQKRIGPSSLGKPCDRCLACELAGIEQTLSVDWLPFIGTSVHNELDVAFTLANGPLDHARWLTEQPVTVGAVNGVEITGTCDLYDVDNGVVIDHKVVGKSTLDKARRHGPSAQYRTQVMAYGLGFQNSGRPVNTVAIAYLPRNAVSLTQAVLWSAPFDAQVAQDALQRANSLAQTVSALTAVNTDARDAYIRSLPIDPDCFSCSRYPAYLTPPTADETATALDGLLTPTK